MPLVCVPYLPVFLLFELNQFVCFVGLYAGHPYIHLISVEDLVNGLYYEE